MAILLSTLLNKIANVPAVADCEITSMTLDSREVSQDTLFVALKGTQQHGLDYAKAVEEQGALAIVWEADEAVVVNKNITIPQFEINDLRYHLGVVADRFYGSPSQSLQMIGITGTDGKTSISHFVAQALDECAVIGTMGAGKLSDLKKATHTTPDVISVHKTLAELKQQNIQTVAMEVSSHALDQGRVANVAFDVAVLSNLSRDHLDYHKTLEAYADAKEKLFHWDGLKAVVLNIDDAFGYKIWSRTKNSIGYGIGKVVNYPEGTLIADNVKLSSKGVSAQIHYGDELGELSVAVLGRFNLSNLLAALGAMIGLDMPLQEALERINKVQTVAGRMEKIADSEVLAVIDYAHTPNALETILKALREHTPQNLICVFGCGGDRDTGKRPLMAAVAEQFADVVIVTDDNPRTESPVKIMQEIVAGFKKPELITVEHDRATAIKQALQQAKSGDAVLIAGKGHENVQILATETIPFSDREQASKALQELAA